MAAMLTKNRPGVKGRWGVRLTRVVKSVIFAGLITPPSGKRVMTYVVTEPCIRCKYTDCVDVCPVDCFHEGGNFLVIDPDECIDCGLCVPECPVGAILAEDDVPDTQQHFIQLNAELAQVWKTITQRKEPPADADEWARVQDKRNLLEK